MASVDDLVSPAGGSTLRQQLFLESRAMAEFALAHGKGVPAAVLKSVEAFERELTARPPEEGETPPELALDALVEAHDTLAQRVAPASPRTILLLHAEQRRSHWLKFLGPVGLVRQMMLLAILCLVLFVVFSLSEDVNVQGGYIYSSDGGMPLLINLLFFLASAGMGASFAALYTANRYITQGTFDPAYYSSYWIRFLLGLIAGLVMSVVVSDKALQGGGHLLTEGIVRPLLAILGGFSADLVYTLLNRLVETLKSLFEGDLRSQVEARNEEARARLEEQAVRSRMRLASELLRLQRELGADPDPEQLQGRLDELLKGLVPERGGPAG